MLHYRLRHAFASTVLSFVHPVDEDNGYRVKPELSTCKKGRACLHLSSHKRAPLHAACHINVHAFADGSVKHSVGFAAAVGADPVLEELFG